MASEVGAPYCGATARRSRFHCGAAVARGATRERHRGTFNEDIGVSLDRMRDT